MRPLTAADVVAALPQRDCFVTRYMRWAVPQTDAPIAYHLATALGLLATTAPTDLSIVYAGPPMHANLFVLVVGRSGEDRKSTATGMGRGLLIRAAPSLAGHEPGSAEGLIDALAVQPTQMISYSEFGSFLARAQEGSYFEAIKTRYNELFDAVPVQRMKASGKGVIVDHPRVSILAACATPYLEKYTEPVDWSGGFMGRWLVFFSHREKLLPFGAAADPTLENGLIAELGARSTASVGRCAGLDADAQRLWVTWFADVSNRPLPDYIVGARARVPTMAMRIALLLGWDYGGARAGGDWYLTTEEIGPAIKIAELHLRSVIAIADVLCESRDMRDRRAVLDVVRARGPLSHGAICKHAKLLKKRVFEILDTLCEEATIALIRVDGEPNYAITAAGAARAAATPETPSAPPVGAGGGTPPSVRPPRPPPPATPTPADDGPPVQGD
jgi:hypothetical protein